MQGGTVDESVTLAAAARRSVTFTVTPADANAAVTVLWNGQAVAPESDGSYSLPYGDYQYLIKAKGYARASADFTVDESSPADISVELTPSRAWDGAAKEAPDGRGHAGRALPDRKRRAAGVAGRHRLGGQRREDLRRPDGRH